VLRIVDADNDITGLANRDRLAGDDVAVVDASIVA